MKRRGLLALGVGVVTGGCLGIGAEPRRRIGRLHLVNHRPEPHSVEVVVETDGEEAFADEYRLGAGPEPSTVLADVPLEDRRAYVIRFSTGDQWVHVYPEEYGDVSGNCIGVLFELHRRGTRGYEVGPSTECR
jgi:hypothetical protein